MIRRLKDKGKDMKKVLKFTFGYTAAGCLAISLLSVFGIYGKVAEIGDHYIIMEVQGQNSLKVDKAAVIKDMTDATPAR